MGLRVRSAGRRRWAAGVAFAAATLTACATLAQQAPLQQDGAPPQQDGAPQQDQSPFHSLAKSFGLATDVDSPPDFIQQSRPAEPQQEIPVFTQPAEPPGKVKSAKEIEAIDSDLEAIVKRHDALRAAYPPSAKAVAAAKKAKSRQKPVAAVVAPPL